MARIVIVIEDKPEGRVRVVSDPTFETMANMKQSGHAWTAAHGYALSCINHLTAVSKKMGPLQVRLPRIGK